jgi:hypothetical protein
MVDRHGSEPARVRPLPRTGAIARVEVRPSPAVAAAGSALAAGARIGGLFGRAGWRVARRLPGGQTAEREAHRVQALAARELRRLLDGAPGGTPRADLSATPEEHRAGLVIQNAHPGNAPLRSAMGELLERSVTGTRTSSREYLYGTIMSQLVPDEARILAALSDRTVHAAGDVVAGRGRRGQRVVLANASTVGRSVGVGTPDNTPTYLTRLHTLGLVEFGPEDSRLETQYEALGADDTVRRARDSAESARAGAARLVRKTVSMSEFGRSFWDACDPSHSRL